MDRELLRTLMIDEQDEIDAGDALPAVAAFRLLQVAASQTRRAMDEQLAAAGLTTQQGMLLTIVRRYVRPTVTQVARAMNVSHQNVRQLVKVLEHKGLLRQVADAEDGRITRLEVTAKQASFWRARNQADFAFVGRMFEPLTRAEQERLGKLLHKLVIRPTE